METLTKEEQIASINKQILEQQELLKGDISEVHEPILNRIIELLNERREIENG